MARSLIKFQSDQNPAGGHRVTSPEGDEKTSMTAYGCQQRLKEKERKKERERERELDHFSLGYAPFYALSGLSQLSGRFSVRVILRACMEQGMPRRVEIPGNQSGKGKLIADFVVSGRIYIRRWMESMAWRVHGESQ